jgi:hypothetical protein
MLIGGLPWMYWVPQAFKNVLAAEGSDDFAYVSGTVGGPVAKAGTWHAPPSFLHEWSRSLVYLPRFDAIVVHDRVNADDPRSMDISGYPPKVQEQMRSMPAVKQWFIHAPVAPRLTSGQIEWELPSRAQVRVDVLLPTGYSATLENEKTTWPKGTPGTGSMAEEQKAWHVRVTPPTQRRWDTFLNVIQVTEGSPATAKLLRSADGQAEGVLVASPGRDSTVLLFNAAPSSTLPDGTASYTESPKILATQRLRRAAYAIQFDTASSVTRVVFLDLDPALSWSASADGRPPETFPRSEREAKVLVLPAAGTHRIQVTPSQ